MGAVGRGTPFMRLHGLGLREPTAYAEPYRGAAIAAFRLRRRLMPYLIESYPAGLAHGLPLLRPMPVQFPDDRAARESLMRALALATSRKTRRMTSCWPWRKSSGGGDSARSCGWR